MSQELLEALYDRDNIPEYPMWVSDSIPVDRMLDFYFITKLDSETLSVNVMIDNFVGESINVSLSRITDDGFSWRGADIIISKYFDNSYDGMNYCYYVLQNLPSVLMLATLL